jgi:hypothetical protein
VAPRAPPVFMSKRCAPSSQLIHHHHHQGNVNSFQVFRQTRQTPALPIRGSHKSCVAEGEEDRRNHLLPLHLGRCPNCRGLLKKGDPSEPHDGGRLWKHVGCSVAGDCGNAFRSRHHLPTMLCCFSSSQLPQFSASTRETSTCLQLERCPSSRPSPSSRLSLPQRELALQRPVHRRTLPSPAAQSQETVE